LVNQLIAAANQLSTSSGQLGNAKTLSPDQLANLVNQVATLTENLANTTVEVAAKTKDTKAQQEILAAAQATLITTQQLALASQDANKNPNDHVASETLSNSVQSANSAINDLISTVQTATAEARRGELELENTANQIKLVLTQSVQDPNASILNVVNGARKATEAIAQLVFATSQEDVVNGAKTSEEAIKLILSNISARAPNQQTQRALIDAAQNASRAMVDLLNAVKSGDRESPQVKALVQNKAEDLTTLLNDLVGVCNRYPEAASLHLVEDNLELKAEQQLLAAVELIKKAAQELSFVHVESGKKKTGIDRVIGLTLDESEISAKLIEAAREVVQSGSQLMESAVSAQAERKQQNMNNQKYRNDPTWANGLISASKNCAGGIMMLVRACNGAIKGDIEEEAIIAVAGNIASSTAQLVTASRVRADVNSRAQKKLDESAKLVARATDRMVASAKQVTEMVEASEEILPGNTSIKSKLEQQMSILKLEKELEQARRKMGKINRDDYRS